MRSVLTMGLLCLLAVSLVSCVQLPEEELKAAEEALAKAQSAEADVYATEVYRSAKNTLDDAKAKVAKDDYEGGKTAAIRAKELADQSRSQAETKKVKTRDEAQGIINRTSTGLADARAAVGAAPRGKGADGDLDQLQADLAQAESGLADASNKLGAGKFKDSLSQANAAEGKLGQANSALQTAMRKVEDWKEANKAWYLR